MYKICCVTFHLYLSRIISQLHEMTTPPLTPRITPTTISPLGSPTSKKASASASRPAITLEQPSGKNKSSGGSKSTKLLRRVRSVFRSLPIITPMCKFPVGGGTRLHENHVHGGTRVTGTLFGYRKTRVNIAIQENPRSLPILLLELSIPTGKLLQDLGVGLVRIALECEKKPSAKIKIIDEPIWTLYCNGRKSGYGVKRQSTDEDLLVMQMLHAGSMGAGVLPVNSCVGGAAEQGGGAAAAEGDLTYMRAPFERVIGSRDSETYYMMNPDGNGGPELSIFFVRI
ncbi:PREDICTED: protein MIZU-KUSSEI 1-like [Tarenaya hassleriana]|uniref:protein MIZU-KUSSEI 1-like n=1 Tax=Tarenaya hassleriana TaxID=28532 RepID=UPI00053CA63B|nr:PREDICTED: protein MIZU-KUSSEI 1-like [Tarenaya hassleriana]